MRQATAELVQEGWLYKVKSKGSFVSERKVPRDFVTEVGPYGDSIEAMGMKPETKILKFEMVPASQVSEEVRRRMGVSEEARLIHVVRERFGDGKPMVLVDSYLVRELCGEIREEEFGSERLYNILSRRDSSRVVSVERDVTAGQATRKEAQLLEIGKGRLILKSTSVGSNHLGRPVEYSEILYREKQVRIAARIPDGRMKH